MDLATGQEITRLKVTACIMTRLVVDRVEEIAIKQGYQTLKFYNRKWEKVILENADLLAGVGGIVDINENAGNLAEVIRTKSDGKEYSKIKQATNSDDKTEESLEPIDPEELAELAEAAGAHPAGVNDDEIAGGNNAPEVDQGDGTSNRGGDFSICESNNEEGSDDVPSLASEEVESRRPTKNVRQPERYNPTRVRAIIRRSWSKFTI